MTTAAPQQDPGAPAVFAHEIRVRYVDCDMQGVVFNAHYLTFADDAIDVWLQHVLGRGYLDRFQYMVKKATTEWFGPARSQDVLTLLPQVSRWGRTSFDLTVDVRCDDRPVAVVELVAVNVTPGTHVPAPVPDDVRAALAGP